MQNDTRLFFVYQRVEPYLYGAISVVGPEAVAQRGIIPLEWSYPYVVSKHLQDREIVYGSILHLIDDAAKPIFRMNHRLRALADSLPEEIRSSIRVSHTDNALIHESSSEFPDWFLHQQEELTKEGAFVGWPASEDLVGSLERKTEYPRNPLRLRRQFDRYGLIERLAQHTDAPSILRGLWRVRTRHLLWTISIGFAAPVRIKG